MRSQRVTEENRAVGIEPQSPWRIAEVCPMSDYGIHVRFLDGTSGEVYLKRLVFSERAGVFAALRDVEVFEQVGLEYGAVTWPGEIDLAPDAMYEEIKRNGKWIL